MSETLNIAKELISKKSITPEDAGCQDFMIQRLEKLGFEIENMPHGDVKNFYAKKGTSSPLIVFAGHTDVIPPGPLESGCRLLLNQQSKIISSTEEVQPI